MEDAGRTQRLQGPGRKERGQDTEDARSGSVGRKRVRPAGSSAPVRPGKRGPGHQWWLSGRFPDALPAPPSKNSLLKTAVGQTAGKTCVGQAVVPARTPRDLVSEWRPHRPVVTALRTPVHEAAYVVLHGASPSHVWPSSFSAQLPFLLRFCLWRRTLCSHDELTYDSFHVVLFASRDV